SSDALYAGLDVLKPHIKRTDGQARSKVVIGVISGDTHDIGKNLVKIMLETAEFEVIDLGRDVPAEDFVRIAIEEQAEVIAISTLMTTTMKGIERVIRLLNERNVRDDFQVIVGGSPISQRYADRIGADGYSANASSAVELAKRLVAKKEAAAKASA
ncbi:MAG: cobalamin-dependent protein, partial [Clostridiales Family XIII bacterium]|nr:cobalamin-dependent protein [Clostridiales Family XIII bacterium]